MFLRRNFYSLLLVIIILITLLDLHTLPALATTKQVKLIRTPDEVYSNQFVLVFAYVSEGGKSIELEIKITIEAKTNISELKPPAPFIKTYRIQMIPVPWAVGWYVAYIPGLPSKTWVFHVKLPLRTVTVEFTVTSKVTYKLIVDGSIATSDSYVVKEIKITQYLPPFVYSFIYEALKDPKLIEETFGLGPYGWVVEGGKDVKVIVIAFDESEGLEVNFEYKVSEGAWTTIPLSDNPIMNKLNLIINDINEAIKNMENWVKQYKQDLTIPKSKLTIKVAEATIPPQSPGAYVMFKATAKDVDGNTAISPIGLYYVTNKGSNTRILILDPHIWLWLFQENKDNLLKALEAFKSYELPSEIMASLKKVKNISELITNYDLIQFHHWEYLGKYYNMYIKWPDKNVKQILDEFKPNVIILSNLGLGLENGGRWNWDLRDLNILEYLILYVKHNHAGVIVTHSTLTDEIIWLSCEDRVKIGVRGHVGYDPRDVNIIKERTITALLGMPELALWEYIRDKIAEALCESSYVYAGMLLGSIPLQVPYVPWEGTLKLTPEAEDLGWDLPKEFTIEIPALIKIPHVKAYTQIGWQLALPRTLAYVAWNEASKKGIDFSKFRDRISLLYERITNNTVKTPELSMYLDKAIKHVLKDFYKALNKARIKGTLFSISILIPQDGKELRAFNVTIDVGKETLINLLKKLPVKIIALSPKGLAGIIVHDKFWDPNGYRAVYFSFEVEAARGKIAEKLLINAVEWVRKWSYKEITELLGGIVRVPKEVSLRFKKFVAEVPGKEVFSNGLILNEEGGSEIELNVIKGKLHLTIAHPTTSSIHIDIVKGSANIVKVIKISKHITYAVIEIVKNGTVLISLKALSDVLLNPAYITIKSEAHIVTPTETPTTTPPSPSPSPTSPSLPPPSQPPSSTSSPTPHSSPTPTETLTTPTETPTLTSPPSPTPTLTPTEVAPSPSPTFTPTPTPKPEITKDYIKILILIVGAITGITLIFIAIRKK